MFDADEFRSGELRLENVSQNEELEESIAEEVRVEP